MSDVYRLGLLSLVERKLVLKQGSKSSSMIEKKKSGEEVKAIDSWRKVRFNKFVMFLIDVRHSLAVELGF